MSIFDKINHAIWGEAQAATMPPASHTSATTPATAKPTATAQAAPQSPPPPAKPAASVNVPAPATPTAGMPASPQTQTAPAGTSANGAVDVEAVMEKAVKAKGQKLDWRHSIVDMMKALGMESTLAERKELADELGYTGDAHDSAKMNIWLHKALMQKLAQNGGKVPADLTD